jgi:hypothetical protein
VAKKRRQAAPTAQQKAKTGPEQGPAALKAPSGGADGGENAGKGRLLWLLSLIFIALGYAALKKVDPWGRNAWAIAAPALLLSGYLLIIPAILVTFRRSA